MPAFFIDEFPAEYALHKKYAPSPVLIDIVWTHGSVVADICLQLIGAHGFDASSLEIKSVVQACLMHDIGVYCCGGFERLANQRFSDKPYIQHSVVSAWILLKEGYPASAIQVAYAHKGVGITKEDIQKLAMDLPLDDYVPKTLLQQLVCYASKYHSKAPQWRTAEEVVASLEKYGPEKPKIFAQWYEYFGRVNLEPLQAKYKAEHNNLTNLANLSMGMNIAPTTLTI